MTQDELIADIEATAAALRAAGSRVEYNTIMPYLQIIISRNDPIMQNTETGLMRVGYNKETLDYYFQDEEAAKYLDEFEDEHNIMYFVSVEDGMLWQATGWA